MPEGRRNVEAGDSESLCHAHHDEKLQTREDWGADWARSEELAQVLLSDPSLDAEYATHLKPILRVDPFGARGFLERIVGH